MLQKKDLMDICKCCTEFDAGKDRGIFSAFIPEISRWHSPRALALHAVGKDQDLLRSWIILFWGMLTFFSGRGQTVIAYYSGNAKSIDRYPVGQLTHIIYSFCYLKGDRLYAGRADSLVIKKLVSLKKKYPPLKILLSLGGWGGLLWPPVGSCGR